MARVSHQVIGGLLLAIAALCTRLALVWAVSGEHGSAASYTYEHGAIAENLLAGRGFAIRYLGVQGPTSQQAPLYPLLLAGAYQLLGTATPAAIGAIRCLQCVAGTCLVLLVVWLARSLVPMRPAVSWVAGWGAAAYPAHIYMVTHIQVAVWAALFLTLLLAIVASPRGRQSWRKASLAGLVAGLLLLVEPILAVALPFVALMHLLLDVQADRSVVAGGTSWSHYHSQRLIAPLGRVAAMAGVAALVIAPWLVRNYRVHGEFVFIKSTFGYAFWQGNNPISRGTDKIPVAAAETTRLTHDGSLAGMHSALAKARLQTVYIDDIALAPSGYAEFQGLSEPARSRLLFSRAWQFVRQQPSAYVQLCLCRLRYFLLFDETNPKAANLLYRTSTMIWITLTAVGLVVLWSEGRRLWPVLGLIAAVTAFHTLTIVSARFRIPIEPLTFAFAAAPIAAGIDRWRLIRASRKRNHPCSFAGDSDDASPGPERPGLVGPATLSRRRSKKTRCA